MSNSIGSLYQWKIAEIYNINETSSWFKSALFDLVPLFNIYQKTIQYNKQDILKNPTQEQMEGVQLYYEDLEEAREPLRQKIWEYHLQIKNSKKEKKNTPSLIARFTILDSFRVDDDGYQIVGNFLNRRQQFIDDKQPFSDYVKIVDLRNDSLHYTLEFNRQ